jgi:hypothetical protein
MWIIREVFSGSRVGRSMVGSWEIVTIKKGWIDGHLR